MQARQEKDGAPDGSVQNVRDRGEAVFDTVLRRVFVVVKNAEIRARQEKGGYHRRERTKRT